MADKSRAKLVDRLRKLLASAGSPNEHEAAEARRQAAAFRRKHGIEDAELVPEDKERFAQAGPLAGDEAGWRSDVAVAVARYRGCRALAARDGLFFAGRRPEDAVSQYASIAAEVLFFEGESWSRRVQRGQLWDAIEPVWRAVFSGEAARAVAERLEGEPGRAEARPAVAVVQEAGVEVAGRSEDAEGGDDEEVADGASSEGARPASSPRVADVREEREGLDARVRAVVRLAGTRYVAEDVRRAGVEGRAAGMRVNLTNRWLLR